MFKWTGPRRTNSLVSEFRFFVSETPDFAKPVIEKTELKQNRVVLDEAIMRRLTPGRSYCWKVASVNPHGVTDGVVGHSPPRTADDEARDPNARRCPRLRVLVDAIAKIAVVVPVDPPTDGEYHTIAFEGIGHQDSLIVTKAGEVFEAVGRFLDDEAAP